MAFQNRQHAAVDLLKNSSTIGGCTMRKLLIFLLSATASGCVQFDPEPETHWVDISGANRGGDALSMNSAQCQLLAAQTQANAQASLTPIQAPPNCYDATCKMLAVMAALSQGRSIAQVGDNTYTTCMAAAGWKIGYVQSNQSASH